MRDDRRPRAEADATLRRLVGSGLLENLGRNRFAFRHALIAGAVLSEIEAAELARLHAAAAAALEARGAPGAEVAHHLFAAGRGAEAVPIAIAAAAEAERRTGYSEATSLYERAANASADPAEVGHLLTKAAWLAPFAVNPRRGRDLAAHAVKVLREAGLPAGHARAVLGHSMVQLGQQDAGHAELLAAIEELDLGGPSPELANALRLAGTSEMSSMRVEESLAHCERSLAVAEQVGDWRTAIGAKATIATVLGLMGSFDESVRLLDELIELALAAGIHYLAAVSTGNLSSVLVGSLRGREAIAALARFDDPRFGELAPQRHQFAALTLATVGYPVRALAEAEAATTAQGIISLTRLAYARVWALVMLDRAAEALRWLESADGTIPAGRSSQPPSGRSHLAMLRFTTAITVHVAMGAVAAAADEAGPALDWEAPCFRYFAMVAEPAVEALLIAGRRDDAERGLAAWRSGADQDDPWWRLALARTELDRDPVAAALSARVSVQAFSDAGYAWDECRARRILAQALSAIGDRAAAIEQLQVSLGTAKERGIAYEARRAREGLAALGGQSDLPTPDSVRAILERLDNASGDMRARMTALIDDLVAAGGREGEAGMILRDYYVKKIGSQEVVAERHYITRPTFYRRLHLGWELLASRLGPLDELPASSAQGR